MPDASEQKARSAHGDDEIALAPPERSEEQHAQLRIVGPEEIPETRKLAQKDREHMPRWDPHITTFYAQMPKWLLRRTEVTLAEKVVYASLIAFKGSNKRAWPSRQTLATSVGLSVRQTEEAIGRLKARGLIHVVRIGLGKTNDYFFLDHEWIQEEDLTNEGKQYRLEHPKPSS